MDKLEGENVITRKIEVAVRRKCDFCGKIATRKHTWLLKGTRSNPASKAYGRDDCSWCEDDCSFTCDNCSAKPPEGYVRCSEFSAGERFAHKFLTKQPVKLSLEMKEKFDELVKKL